MTDTTSLIQVPLVAPAQTAGPKPASDSGRGGMDSGAAFALLAEQEDPPPPAEVSGPGTVDLGGAGLVVAAAVLQAPDAVLPAASPPPPDAGADAPAPVSTSVPAKAVVPVADLTAAHAETTLPAVGGPSGPSIPVKASPAPGEPGDGPVVAAMQAAGAQPVPALAAPAQAAVPPPVLPVDPARPPALAKAQAGTGTEPSAAGNPAAAADTATSPAPAVSSVPVGVPVGVPAGRSDGAEVLPPGSDSPAEAAETPRGYAPPAASAFAELVARHGASVRVAASAEAGAATGVKLTPEAPLTVPSDTGRADTAPPSTGVPAVSDPIAGPEVALRADPALAAVPQAAAAARPVRAVPGDAAPARPDPGPVAPVDGEPKVVRADQPHPLAAGADPGRPARDDAGDAETGDTGTGAGSAPDPAPAAGTPAAATEIAAARPAVETPALVPAQGDPGLAGIGTTMVSAASGARYPEVAEALGGTLRPTHDLPVAQIAQAGIAGAPGVTEIRLSPEELGSIRMDLRTDGDRATLVVSAERPETLDLLRRNADRLAEEFRAAGFQDLDLGFGRWSGSDDRPSTPGNRHDPPAPSDDPRGEWPDAAVTLAAAPLARRSGAGLYVRF